MDLDGDGRPDLLSGSNCCDPCGFVLFRRGGDGAWGPRRDRKVTVPAPRSILNRSFVTAADWDGDGVPDLLWLDGNSILVGPGPVRDADPVALGDRFEVVLGGAAAGAALLDFVVADWDGDGRPDLLVRWEAPGGGGGIDWHKSLGRGLTRLADARPLVRLAGGGQSATGFCVCDWDAASRPGLVVTTIEDLPRAAAGGPRQVRQSVWLYPRK